MFKPIQNQNVPNYIFSFRTKQQTNTIVSAFSSLQTPIRQLLNATKNSKAKSLLSELKSIEGISGLNDKFISVSDKQRQIIFNLDKDGFVKIRERIPNSTRNTKLLLLKQNQIINASGFGQNTNAVEEFLNGIFEIIDTKIVRIKQKLISKPTEKLLKQLGPKGILDEEKTKIVQEIEYLFNTANEKIDGLITSPVTRNKIKNGYKSMGNIGQHGSKQLKFSNIGICKEDFLVNSITDKKGERHLVIRIFPKNNTDTKNIIINPKGEVFKSKILSRTANLGEHIERYSPEELDNYSFKGNLTTLKNELVKYNDYLSEKTNELAKSQEKYMTSEKGILNNQFQEIIKEIQTNYEILRKKMSMLKTPEFKTLARESLSISTKESSPSIIFRNIEGFYDGLHVSFPKLNGKTCAKINILGYKDNIKQSYFIENGSLIKYEAPSLGRSKRSDTKNNYYSNEEIENSGVKDCLFALNERLKQIKDKISSGRCWYRN